MSIVLNTVQTIALLISFILLGYFIKSKVPILNKLYIPAPFIGGLLLSILILALSPKIKISINFSLFTVFFASFFASIGLRVDKNIFKNGIFKQMVFLVIVVSVAIMQNVFIIILGKIFSLPKKDMIMFSSLNLVGDHSFAQHAVALVGDNGTVFLSTLSGISVFCVILAIISSTIVFKLLEPKADFSEIAKTTNPTFTTSELLKYLLILFAATGIAYIPTQLGFGKILSPLGGGLFAGIIIRFILDKLNIFNIQFSHMNFIGNIFLSLLLVTGFASLDISTLSMLTPKAILIVLMQISWLIVFSYFIVFKIYGKNTLAAYIATGLTAIGIGFPPNSLSSIQCCSEEKGVIPDLIFIVPPIGSWLIGLINPHIVNWFFSF